jgi:hypothetical protein
MTPPGAVRVRFTSRVLIPTTRIRANVRVTNVFTLPVPTDSIQRNPLEERKTMWGSADVYENPDSFGLEKIAEAQKYEPDYNFDMIVIWYREVDDQYYWGSDAGCSCPSPFEDVSLDEEGLRDPDRINDVLHRNLDSGPLDEALADMSLYLFTDRHDYGFRNDPLRFAIKEYRNAVKDIFDHVRQR